MRQIVRDSFVKWTSQFEGRLPYMYLDVRGLVTTGIGDLIDPLPPGMDWVYKATGKPATGPDIYAEWVRVKAAQSMKLLGGGAFARLTTLRLTDSALDELATHRFLLNEAWLLHRFPAWETWPAAAQMGTHSCSWAAGPGWVAPKFDAAAKALDWQTCAGYPGDAGNDLLCRGEAWLNDTGNSGLRPRNLANKDLFQWAVAQDPDSLPA